MIKSSLKTQPFTFACLLLAVSLTFFACSGDDGNGGDDDNNNVTKTEKERISGVSQKGPFIKGSLVTIYELDENLSQTGQRTYTSPIIDDKGTFEKEDLELVSSYVLLEADGFYRNEVNGEKSDASIKLLAVADIADKNNINVNLLTHLEYNRVLNLFKEGKSFSESKEQAQQEVLNVFGINGDFSNSEDMSIFGTSESDAALLAISILLQGERKEADFSELLTEFSQAIKERGNWEDVVKKAEIADWANAADLEQIRNNILGWGLSSEVPAFEKYVKSFWNSSYGLGACDASSEGVIKQNANTASVNKDVHYICEKGEWRKATEYEYNGVVCNAENFGEIIVTNSEPTMFKGYVCKNGKWVDASYTDRYCSILDDGNCDVFTDANKNDSMYWIINLGDSMQVLDLNYETKIWKSASDVCPDGWHLPKTLSECAGLYVPGGYVWAGNDPGLNQIAWAFEENMVCDANYTHGVDRSNPIFRPYDYYAYDEYFSAFPAYCFKDLL